MANRNNPTDSADHLVHAGFDTKGLARRTARSSAVTLAAQVIRFGIRFASTIVLARLLAPSDFGLLAMVVTFTRFVTEFKDLGLPLATIQRRELTERQISTMFWINTAFGAAATLLIVACAPLVARFYRQPELTEITMVVGCAFVITGLGLQHGALLRRTMQYKRVAISQVAGALGGTLTSIWMAASGFGYWALVAMNVVAAAVSTISLWISCGWRPGLPSRAEGIGSMLRFGTNLTLARLFNFLARNADNVLIGRYWGAELLGYYTKAYSLLTLPIRQFITPVSGVVVSALSRLQDQPERYTRYYKQTLTMITALTMPAVTFAGAATPELVTVVLGERWLEVIPIFQCLIPAAFVGTYNGAAGWVYVSLDQTGRHAKWGFFSATVIVLAFCVGVVWGPIGVAIAFSVSQVALRHPAIVYALKNTFLEPRDLYSAIRWPTFTSWFAGIASFAIGFWLESLSALPILVSKAVVFTLCYVAAWFAFPGGRETARAALRALRNLRAA